MFFRGTGQEFTCCGSSGSRTHTCTCVHVGRYYTPRHGPKVTIVESHHKGEGIPIDSDIAVKGVHAGRGSWPNEFKSNEILCINKSSRNKMYKNSSRIRPNLASVISMLFLGRN